MQYRPAFDATQPVISFILQTIIVLGLLCLPVAMAALPALLTFNPILIALAVAAAAVSSIGLALFAGRPLGRLLSYPATVVLVTPVWLLDRTLEGLWNSVPDIHTQSSSEASANAQSTKTDSTTQSSAPAVSHLYDANTLKTDSKTIAQINAETDAQFDALSGQRQTVSRSNTMH